MGYQISDLVGEGRPMSLELKHRPGDQSPLRDDSWFMTGDPNADRVTSLEVCKKIPHGRFQRIISLVYFILFISTSTLAYNFAFFLMP